MITTHMTADEIRADSAAKARLLEAMTAARNEDGAMSAFVNLKTGDVRILKGDAWKVVEDAPVLKALDGDA